MRIVRWQHPHVLDVHLSPVPVVESHFNHAVIGRNVKLLDRAREEAVIHLAPVHAHPGANG